MSVAIDITSTPVRYPQFDPDRPVTPLEKWKDGDTTASAEFVEWLASDSQRQELEDLIALHSDCGAVQKLVEQWAKEAN